MRYLLVMYGDETADYSPPVTEAHATDEPCWMPWAREMKERGVLLMGGAQLQPTSAAVTVRTDGSEMLATDGPFAETKEQILGYDVIECADRDEAIYAASRHPVALYGGSIEVRPILLAAD